MRMHLAGAAATSPCSVCSEQPLIKSLLPTLTLPHALPFVSTVLRPEPVRLLRAARLRQQRGQLPQHHRRLVGDNRHMQAACQHKLHVYSLGWATAPTFLLPSIRGASACFPAGRPVRNLHPSHPLPPTPCPLPPGPQVQDRRQLPLHVHASEGQLGAAPERGPVHPGEAPGVGRGLGAHATVGLWHRYCRIVCPRRRAGAVAFHHAAPLVVGTCLGSPASPGLSQHGKLYVGAYRTDCALRGMAVAPLCINLQLVWNSTTSFGCGFATVDNVKVSGGYDGSCKAIVCLFSPPGNWQSDRAFRENGEPNSCTQRQRHCFRIPSLRLETQTEVAQGNVKYTVIPTRSLWWMLV